MCIYIYIYIIGLFVLHQLKGKGILPILYRDDGLLISYKPAKETHKLSLQIIEIFRQNDLNITTEVNKKTTNFLDLTLELHNFTHRVFVKPGPSPLYVHALSNHPTSILKNIPIGVEKRISNLCSNEEIFEECKGFFKTPCPNPDTNTSCSTNLTHPLVQIEIEKEVGKGVGT